MIKQILIGAGLVALASCNNSKQASSSSSNSSTMSNTLSETEKNDGWEQLFDGTTLKGWHKYGGAPTGEAWTVVDNTIHLNSGVKDKGGDIITDQEYENFDLKLDWKIDSGGNSGIIIYSVEDKAKYTWPWETGPEIQVLDNMAHPDAKIIKHRAGDLYDLISSSKETVKPALEWNTVEIKSLNGKLDIYLNGYNAVSTTMWDDNWRKLIAGSKFRDMADFGKFKKGHIGLQDHGNNVWFRNIRIKRL